MHIDGIITISTIFISLQFCITDIVGKSAIIQLYLH